MKRKKILFVCSGNTCRSPMAEAILRSKIKERKIKWWDVSSCGLFAEVGGTISPNSKQALEEIGVKVEKFAPRQLSQSISDRSFAVICMTEKQKQTLKRFEKLMKTMTDRELENLLLVGEGMIIMAGIKEKQGAAKKSA